MNRTEYFDNLLDAAVYSLDDIYEEDYIRRNYTSPTSKVRKVIKNLQALGYIVKDTIIQKYRAIPYDGSLQVGQPTTPVEIPQHHFHYVQFPVSPSSPYTPIWDTPTITCATDSSATETKAEDIDISLTTGSSNV